VIFVPEAHDQNVTHKYTIHYPAHEARKGDPNYVDFNHIRKVWKKDAEKWQCAIGKHRDDFSECSVDQPLELHHNHIEFALMNAVELKWLAKDYPGVDDPKKLGAWVESADNLLVLCQHHHRGRSGVHTVAAADYEASKYIRGLFS